MGRAYNVIDADGHILEPVDLWDNYIEPAFRVRAPRMFVDTDGKERLNIDGTMVQSSGDPAAWVAWRGLVCAMAGCRKR